MPSRVNRQSLSLEIWPQYECGTHTSSFSHCPCGTPGCFEEFGSKQENSGSHNGGTRALPFHTSVFAGEWLQAFWFLPYGTIGPFSLLASSNQLLLLAINYDYSFFKGEEIKVTKGRGYKKGNCQNGKGLSHELGLGFRVDWLSVWFRFGVLLEHSAPFLAEIVTRWVTMAGGGGASLVTGIFNMIQQPHWPLFYFFRTLILCW